MSGERHGTVFIAERFPFGVQPTFVGYWDAEPDDRPAILEEMPETSDVDEALAWGRARAEVVFIRVLDRDDWSAGDRDPADGVPHWPPSPDVLADIDEARRRLAPPMS